MMSPSVFSILLTEKRKDDTPLAFSRRDGKVAVQGRLARSLQEDKGCSLCPEDHDILWEGVEGEKRGLDKSLVFINKGSFQKLNPAAWKDIRGHQTILTLELSLLMKTSLVVFDYFLHTLIVPVFQCVTGEVSPSDVLYPLLLQGWSRGGRCENGVTARIGAGSQESEFFIFLISFFVGCPKKMM